MLPQSLTDWIALVILLGAVAICAFGAGAALKSPVIDEKVQQIGILQKDNSGLRTTLQWEREQNGSLQGKLTEVEKRLSEAFNAYRSIELNANATTSVSTGGFTIRLVGAPANGKVSINVNGTQYLVAAKDAVPAGIANCQVQVKSFESFKVTLLTSCPPPTAPKP